MMRRGSPARTAFRSTRRCPSQLASSTPPDSSMPLRIQRPTDGAATYCFAASVAKPGPKVDRRELCSMSITSFWSRTRTASEHFASRIQGQKTFLANSDRPIPPLVRLGTLLSAATRVIDDKESDNDLRLLLAPGASLGGARPKASVVDRNDHLLIAKFPSPNDDWPVPRWEATAMALARAAGIRVPPSELHEVNGRPVFVMRRFDRDEAKQRLPFISAMTALGASDGDIRSYIELLDLLRQDGVAPDQDAAELWRRMVFNVLISNTDDHLRNHGYLREPGGWRLAPAYDLNPMPVDVKPRHHALTLDETDDASSIDTVVSVAEYFGLKLPQAKQIVAEVAAAVLDWRGVAAANGLTVAQIDRMASAFEHGDLLKAAA